MERLLLALPANAEEGSTRVHVEETDLIRVLEQDAPSDAALAIVGLIRRLFQATCLLDDGELEKGRWAFVSFPAELMARSLLSTLSTPGQTLFPLHYWEQDAGKPEDEIESQRRLLHFLEDGRQRFHPSRQASPIRFVYVAWGVIRLGDRYLLVQREDRDRSKGGVPHWVLTGGRLALKDLPRETRQKALAGWSGGLDGQLLGALELTLARELEEEVGLLPEHYAAHRFQVLDSYRQVEGARNSHALTQYFFALYSILLEPGGELALMQTEQAAPEKMAWFTADELLNDNRPDGKRAYVNALKAGGYEAARVLLAGVPDSGSPSLRLPTAAETCAVDLPGSYGSAFLVGKTGKEQPLRCDLLQEEWELLMLLAWHAKDLPCQPSPEHVSLLHRGWIVLKSRLAQGVADQLVRKLQGKAPLPTPRLLNGQFVRLDIDPRLLFLARTFFRVEVPEGEADSRLAIHLEAIDTTFGHLGKATSVHELSRSLVRALLSIEQGDGPGQLSDPDRQFRDAFKSSQAIGLRKLVYVDKKEYRMGLRRTLA
ncbi:NUDIX domain-containing protein [Roseateles cellulosilyticus]|uniref:NUDIX hydrolase n=1 Tax=Pelomonas cellulosilytica TaxID=2906762 RepID=A0ABS8XWY6_9BURK|nr:NUDIX hydrolase [Pelomonas sp. P8]MCE4553800.1 NUDIX hydrolase [Pelomonas sp. P8]